MFRIMNVYHHEVCCRIKHYGIVLCPSMYGTVMNHLCLLYIGWSRYTGIIVEFFVVYMKVI
jgi:hypothetical protein